MKKFETKYNSVGGIDLLVPRDSSDNLVLVLTGNASSSLAFWSCLKRVCEEAIGKITVTNFAWFNTHVKDISLIDNFSGGIDLMVERDSGNLVRVLTGNKSSSLTFWQDLFVACEQSLENIVQLDKFSGSFMALDEVRRHYPEILPSMCFKIGDSDKEFVTKKEVKTYVKDAQKFRELECVVVTFVAENVKF